MPAGKFKEKRAIWNYSDGSR